MMNNKDLPAEFRFVLDGKMLAWLHLRPHYCDRGRYDAHVEVGWTSDCDPWPRYYFNPEHGKSEIEEYLKAKKVDITGAVWVTYSTDADSILDNPYATANKVL